MNQKLKLIAVFIASFSVVNIAGGHAKTVSPVEASSGNITIVDSNGKPAGNASLFSVSKTSSRGRLLNATPSDGFSPQLIDDKGQPIPKVDRINQAIPGAIVMLADSNGVAKKPADSVAMLVVSRDRKEVSFVPPEYKGTVHLRPCGKLEFDLSGLDSQSETCTVVVVWKNCLAGAYSLIANKVPGDPECEVHMDWRLNAFFQVTTIFKIDPKARKLPEIYLPPGEASVAVITEKQLKLLSDFQGPDFDERRIHHFALLPATSGIHQIIESKATTVPLRTGTCFEGKIAIDSTELPDWQDPGFADANLSISEDWTSRLDRLPGYEISKGVNHYVKVLQSDIGLTVRSQTMSRHTAFLKSDGRFITKPLPKGEYGGCLYRPNQTVERQIFTPSGKTETQVVAFAPLLRSEADRPNPIASLDEILLAARKAVWGGDVKTASQSLESARKFLVRLDQSGESTAAIHSSFNEIAQMIEVHSRLIEMANENDQNYNSKASSFLLTQSDGFLKQSEFFLAEQVVFHSKRFASDTKIHDQFLSKIRAAKENSFNEPAPITKYLKPFRVKEKSSEIVDVGKLIFDLEKTFKGLRTPSDSFNPLQTLPKTDLAVFRRLKALVFRERVAAEKTLNVNRQEGIKQLIQIRDIITDSNVPPKSLAPLLELINGDIVKWQSQIELPSAKPSRTDSSIYRQIQQIKAMNEQTSARYKLTVEKLRSAISKRFDDKLRERQSELESLDKQIKKAQLSLEQRKANRTKIIEHRLRNLLSDEGTGSK